MTIAKRTRTADTNQAHALTTNHHNKPIPLFVLVVRFTVSAYTPFAYTTVHGGSDHRFRLFIPLSYFNVNGRKCLILSRCACVI